VSALRYERWQHSKDAPGGSDCFSLSALSESVTDSVYKYLLHRTLNLVARFVFFTLTAARTGAREAEA
jgi:hypothetical protein